MEPSREASAALSPAVLRETRVLVVDDVPANRDLLVRRLRRLGIGHCTVRRGGGNEGESKYAGFGNRGRRYRRRVG